MSGHFGILHGSKWDEAARDIFVASAKAERRPKGKA